MYVTSLTIIIMTLTFVACVLNIIFRENKPVALYYIDLFSLIPFSVWSLINLKNFKPFRHVIYTLITVTIRLIPILIIMFLMAGSYFVILRALNLLYNREDDGTILYGQVGDSIFGGWISWNILERSQIYEI